MIELFLYGFLALSAVFCAYRAMIATRILSATLWLAAVSALTAIMLYLLGAYQVAVIELSVGAGLVTVLMVYAISVVGDDARDLISMLPKPLAGLFSLLAAVILAAMALPLIGREAPAADISLENVLWQNRALDVWVQIVLISSGVMGLLGLLAEGRTRPRSGLNTLTEVMGRQPAAPDDLQPADTYLIGNDDSAPLEAEIPEETPVSNDDILD